MWIEHERLRQPNSDWTEFLRMVPPTKIIGKQIPNCRDIALCTNVH